MSPISFAEFATWSLCADSIASIQEPKRTGEKEQMWTVNAFPFLFWPTGNHKKKHANVKPSFGLAKYSSYNVQNLQWGPGMIETENTFDLFTSFDKTDLTSCWLFQTEKLSLNKSSCCKIWKCLAQANKSKRMKRNASQRKFTSQTSDNMGRWQAEKIRVEERRDE